MFRQKRDEKRLNFTKIYTEEIKFFDKQVETITK